MHVPDVYFIAYPGKNVFDLQQEFLILLRLLSCGLTTLLEFMKSMNCGLASSFIIPALYRIGKDMQTRPAFINWNSDTELLMFQLTGYARQNLIHLSSRFLIATDLLQRLDDEARAGLTEPL
jgi:hypothetical protein